ncbi:MAG: hypothetical protein NTU41_09800, partial [Chloroflexi bacterium]|nr:hypothetical protein [Chloroflexota bacterium]
TGTFPGGNPFHTWEGVGFVATGSEFEDQYTFLGEWYGDSGGMSNMEAGGYVYRNGITQEANDGWWPAQYSSSVSTPWSEKLIWNDPGQMSY